MTDDYAQDWKDHYAERRAGMRYTASGSMRKPDGVSALSVDEDERQGTYEARWNMGGMAFLRSFTDLLTSQEANDTAAEFVRQQIRKIVKDPEVAERLAPTSYPVGTKRICVDTGYYETFNRDNVELVDIVAGPIETLTRTGLAAGGRDFTFDSIIFATGFDAMTGTLLKVDIRGRDGLTLKDKWYAGPRTYLGIMSEAFPNLFMITGPGSPSVKGNMATSIEQHVDFVTDCLVHLRAEGIDQIEPELEAEDAWVDHVQEAANATLFPCANSWYMGANIPGKPQLFMPYIGGVGTYRQKCEEIAADGYRGFRLKPAAASAAAE
ncbi:MAG: hypothetical protein HOK82_11890 [Rhodospirillaceae bacterium]|nr:hypothetical protein [Rhodospirillaceae bacterium]